MSQCCEILLKYTSIPLNKMVYLKKQSLLGVRAWGDSLNHSAIVVTKIDWHT